MAEAKNIIDALWETLCHDLLYTGRNYLSSDDIEWGTKALLDIISDNMSPETLYRGLALLNRCSHSGRFALTYNNNIYTAIKNRSNESLRKIFTAGEFPEGENKTLNSDEKLLIAQQLKREIIAVNLALDRASVADLKDTSIHDVLHILKPVCQNEANCSYNSCLREVCISVPVDEIKLQENDITFMTPILPKNVMVIGKIRTINYIWCFDIIDLVQILVKHGNNPYTGEPFDPELYNQLVAKYALEIKMLS